MKAAVLGTTGYTGMLLARLLVDHPEVDRILPGLTCRRDLIMELADGLAREGITLGLYYHHGASNTDPATCSEWQKAVGVTDVDRSRYYDNYCKVIAWMGTHYGKKVIFWWFDSDSVFMKYPETPWPRMTAAAMWNSLATV